MAWAIELVKKRELHLWKISSQMRQFIHKDVKKVPEFECGSCSLLNSVFLSIGHYHCYWVDFWDGHKTGENDKTPLTLPWSTSDSVTAMLKAASKEQFWATKKRVVKAFGLELHNSNVKAGSGRDDRAVGANTVADFTPDNYCSFKAKRPDIWFLPSGHEEHRLSSTPEIHDHHAFFSFAIYPEKVQMELLCHRYWQYIR